ncbi:nuclear transport factor 2 family protein [Streptomyces sp. NPDC004609]|uniref:nuclear transport factor 2 family protein n=1 Tax=Streptomyces sp. NPDC004609 TaxID=3364704 RepID=UPI0036763CDA
MTDIVTFADDFFGAVANGDIDAVRRYYRDDVKVWHNFDNLEQDKATNVATLASIPDRYDTFEYAEIRHTPIEGGFLRQHVIKASRNGKRAYVPAILRVYVEDGQVYRIEEYFDYGQLKSALGF